MAGVNFTGSPTPQADAEAADFYIPVLVVMISNWLFGIFCQFVNDNSWIDTWWGLSFVFPNLALIIKRYTDGNDKDVDARTWVVFSLILVWALRLAIHIGIRHKVEDFRYQDMRRDWNEKGGRWGYLWRTFVFIFTMQGVFSLIVNSSALYVSIYSKSENLIWVDFVGIFVWAFGFFFEWIGDEQLKSHIADKTPGKKKFINHGLWHYTRHPNYFGEAVLWWGIYLIACGVETGWATFFAPLFITVLVRFVSGVPLLEQKYKGNPEWEEYCRQVNVFFPWIPKAAIPIATEPLTKEASEEL